MDKNESCPAFFFSFKKLFSRYTAQLRRKDGHNFSFKQLTINYLNYSTKLQINENFLTKKLTIIQISLLEEFVKNSIIQMIYKKYCSTNSLRVIKKFHCREFTIYDPFLFRI